jgi:flagellar hook-associated protein 3 FlgL
LDFAQARGEARDIENGRLISVNEDIDLTEALSRLTTQQTVYKASLEIGSRVMQTSLMDYLR